MYNCGLRCSDNVDPSDQDLIAESLSFKTFSNPKPGQEKEPAKTGTTAVTESSHGEVAEWSNVPDSKSGVRYPRTVGSNPTLSANLKAL